jgi:hypothetical protein
LDRNTFSQKSEQGVFCAHGENASILTSQEFRDGFSSFTEIELALHSSKLNIKW